MITTDYRSEVNDLRKKLRDDVFELLLKHGSRIGLGFVFDPETNGDMETIYPMAEYRDRGGMPVWEKAFSVWTSGFVVYVQTESKYNISWADLYLESQLHLLDMIEDNLEQINNH